MHTVHWCKNGAPCSADMVACSSCSANTNTSDKALSIVSKTPSLSTAAWPPRLNLLADQQQILQRGLQCHLPRILCWQALARASRPGIGITWHLHSMGQSADCMQINNYYGGGGQGGDGGYGGGDGGGMGGGMGGGSGYDDPAQGTDYG